MATKTPITGHLLLPSSPYLSLRAASSRRSVVSCPPLRTSFFNGGVGVLKAIHMQMSSFNGHQCGALGSRMNLFNRLARVIKSYANAILSSVEDPEKILEQTVLEMSDDLIKMRQAASRVVGSHKRLGNKCKAAQQASDDWDRRAQLALTEGCEDLAREALRRRKLYADKASSLKTQFDQQKGVVDNLHFNTRLLESKIQEAMAKKDTLKARAQSAKTASKVNELLGNVNTSSALLAFEKMEEKVMAMESEAEALHQLSYDDVEGKFASLESLSVEDDIAELKKKLLQRSWVICSTNTLYWVDMDKLGATSSKQCKYPSPLGIEGLPSVAIWHLRYQIGGKLN